MYQIEERAIQQTSIPYKLLNLLSKGNDRFAPSITAASNLADATLAYVR